MISNFNKVSCEQACNKRIIACVTGASGMVGSRIVNLLLLEGCEVRVLTRRSHSIDGVTHFQGDIRNPLFVDDFISGSDIVFHSAAELIDESSMWDVNVVGTKNILISSKKYAVKQLLYISSAGVIGRTSELTVDELTPCSPVNTYEKSKFAAENLVKLYSNYFRVVIIRPTNVVDESKLGEIGFFLTPSIANFAKLILKGGECAHVVHSEDVARAAVFLMKGERAGKEEIYFVSIDSDPLNKLSSMSKIYRSMSHSNLPKFLLFLFGMSLPIVFPYLIRRFLGKESNWGSTQYSSSKLLEQGFVYSYHVYDIIKKISDNGNPGVSINSRRT